MTEFTLGRPTPSPSAGPTRFEFALPRAAHVRLRAFDVRGREVATVADGDYPAGRHAATWDRTTNAGPAPAGVCFLRLGARRRAHAALRPPTLSAEPAHTFHLMLQPTLGCWSARRRAPP